MDRALNLGNQGIGPSLPVTTTMSFNKFYKEGTKPPRGKNPSVDVLQLCREKNHACIWVAKQHS